MKPREATDVRLASIVAIFVLMSRLSSGGVIGDQEVKLPEEMTSPNNEELRKSEGASLKTNLSPKEGLYNDRSVSRVNCSQGGGGDKSGYLCSGEQTLQKTNKTAGDTTRTAKDTLVEINKTNKSTQEMNQAGQTTNDAVTQTVKNVQGTDKTTNPSMTEPVDDTNESISQTTKAVQGTIKTVQTTSTTPALVNDTNESVPQTMKAVQGTDKTVQTTSIPTAEPVSNTSESKRTAVTDANKIGQTTSISTSAPMYVSEAAPLRDKTTNSTQDPTTQATERRTNATRVACNNTLALAEPTAKSPEETTLDQTLPNIRENTSGNKNWATNTTVTQNNEGTKRGIISEERTTTPQDSREAMETRSTNHIVVKATNVSKAEKTSVEATIRTTQALEPVGSVEKLDKDASRGSGRRVQFAQRYVILDAEQRTVIRGMYAMHTL